MPDNFGRETVVFFELVQPFCSHVWGDGVGVSPSAGCEAVLSASVPTKCRNCRVTCADTPNYNPQDLVLRFARPQEGLLQYGNVLPLISGTPSTTPAKINLAGLDKNTAALGEREVVQITLTDCLHSDHLVDKYRLERATGAASEFSDGLHFEFLDATLVAEVGSDVATISFTRSGATATRVNESGLIETVAANTARFDFDPTTLECKGILIEEARTNITPTSAALGSLNVITGVTVTPNTDVAPDGTLSADTITRIAGAGDKRLQDNRTVANDSNPWTFSLYVKKTNGTVASCQIKLVITGGGTPVQAAVEFDPTSGNVLSSSGTHTLEDKGNYWRASATVSNNSTGNTTTAPEFYPDTTSTGSESKVAWGWQVEQGAFPTSYIPTAGATVTRNADTPLISDISGFYNETEGTIVAEFTTASGLASGATQNAISFTNGTANERIQIQRVTNGIGELVVDGGVSQSADTPVVDANSTTFTVAFGYAANRLSTSVDGSAAASDTSASLPTVDRCYLGSFDGSNSMLNGHLRRFTYYNRKLLGSELVAISGSDLPAHKVVRFASAYDPYTVGTFWGKWIARNPYYSNYECRIREGFLGDALEDMNVRYYVVDKIEGPTEGLVRITAKDKFSMVEERKAVAPRPSNGILSGALSSSATSFDVQPAGIGGEYTDSGYVCIGEEIVSFTRVYDTFTITRGQLGTTAAAHDDESTVQQVLTYTSEAAYLICYDLLTTYTGIDPADINLTEWAARAASLTTLYSANIANPTPVMDLVGELCKQGGMTIYPEVSSGMIKLATLRATGQNLAVNDQAKILDGISIKRQDNKRISQVWVYYGQIDPTKDLTDETNYKSRLVEADLTAESSQLFGAPAIEKIFSRWIPSNGRAIAQALADRILLLFTNPPIEASLTLDNREIEFIDLAWFMTIDTADVQDFDGNNDVFTAAVTQIEYGENKIDIVAQQIDFSQDDGSTRNIYIDNDVVDLNLRTLHDSQYSPPLGGSPGETINFFISSGAFVFASSTLNAALTVGSWPAGVTVTLTIDGEIHGQAGTPGRGGDAVAVYVGSNDEFGFDPIIDQGNFYANNGENGTNGGPAIDASGYNISITNNGAVRGGAGGSGGGAGIAVFKRGGGHAISGSGAGASERYPTGSGANAGGVSFSYRGSNGIAGSSGTSTSTGAGGGQVLVQGVDNVTLVNGTGGNGVVAGQNGNSGGTAAVTANGGGAGYVETASSPGTGGTVGAAAIGDSNITWTVAGTREGALVP